MKLFAGKINPPPSPPPLHLLGFCGFLGLLELCASCGHLCLYLGDAVCHSLYRPEKKTGNKHTEEKPLTQPLLNIRSVKGRFLLLRRSLPSDTETFA